MVACTTILSVIVADSPLVPSKPPAKTVPLAIAALVVRAAVVDDDVRDHLDTSLVECLHRSVELLLGTILAIELVQITWEVALCAKVAYWGGEARHGLVPCGLSCWLLHLLLCFWDCY